jgi:foldase protein PrsA
MKKLSLVVLALACALVAAPDSHAQALPPATLPSGTVALVWATPVLKSDFDHWMTIAAAESDEDMPAPGTKALATLRDQVMQLLVSFEWIKGETAMRQVTVSEKAVRRSFTQQKRQSFPKESDYQKFLRHTHQTDADVLERVRLNLLADRLRDKVQARAKTAKGKQLLLDRFVAEFMDRWKTVTVCGQGYESTDCGRTVPIDAG